MSDNKDFRPVFEELRNQGWDVVKTGQGHYRAKPPTGNGIVHFAASAERHALKNALADLKKHGFTWPPPTKQELRELRAANGVAEDSVSAEEPSLDAGKDEGPITEERMDQLWKELKEAKAYVTLAVEHEAECERTFAAALLKKTEAGVEREKAVDKLRLAKDAFDRAFASAAE